MNAPPPLVVLVTCYREGELLRRALASLDSQTDTDFDLVIVNDCSPDPTTNLVCEEAAKRPRTRVIRRESNGGLSAARNTGFAVAPTESVVVPLDADDELPPEAIREIRSAFARSPDASFAVGDYTRVDIEDGRTTRVTMDSVFRSGGLDASALVRQWLLLGTSPCKRGLWESIGGYSLRYSNTLQDMDFWIRVLERDMQAVRVHSPIYTWYRAASGMNSQSCIPRELPRIYIEHMPFLDRLGLGVGIRRSILNTFLNQREYGLLREHAAKWNDVGWRKIFAWMPVSIVRPLHGAFRAIRRSG